MEEISRYTMLRTKAAKAAGRGPGPEANTAKLSMSRMTRLTRDLGLEILGAKGMLHGADAPMGGMLQEMAIFAPAVSIYGGQRRGAEEHHRRAGARPAQGAVGRQDGAVQGPAGGHLPERRVSGRLDGKVAVVTGGGNGIGRACCERFAEEGADVVVADLLDEAGAEAVEAVEKLGGGGLFVHVDASSPDDNTELVRRAVDRFGHVDVVVTAAGISHAEYRSGDRSRDEEMLTRAIETRSEPARRLLDLELASVAEGARREPHGDLPRRPGHRPADGGAGERRLDRHHRLGGGEAPRGGPAVVRGVEGGRVDADQGGGPQPRARPASG